MYIACVQFRSVPPDAVVLVDTLGEEVVGTPPLFGVLEDVIGDGVRVGSPEREINGRKLGGNISTNFTRDLLPMVVLVALCQVRMITTARRTTSTDEAS